MRGYKVISVPDDSLVYAKKRIFEHRFIMALHLGRELLDNETVHHINGDKLDNRIENLELWSSNHGRGQRVTDKINESLCILKPFLSEELFKSVVKELPSL